MHGPKRVGSPAEARGPHHEPSKISGIPAPLSLACLEGHISGVPSTSTLRVTKTSGDSGGPTVALYLIAPEAFVQVGGGQHDWRDRANTRGGLP